MRQSSASVPQVTSTLRSNGSIRRLPKSRSETRRLSLSRRGAIGEFDRSVRRLVVPLIEVTGHLVLTPIFTIEGRQVVADALLMFSIPHEKLGPVVPPWRTIRPRQRSSLRSTK